MDVFLRYLAAVIVAVFMLAVLAATWAGVIWLYQSLR
jgi:hypothetical protein